MATLGAMALTPTLTVPEVMQTFKVSRKTLERWEKDGILIPLRIGVNVRYREADVRALIDGRASA